jgi:hypothetical protein
MISEIQGLLQSFSVLKNLIDANRSLKNSNEFIAAIHEINTKLMTVSQIALESQNEQFKLRHIINELEIKIKEYEDWKRESEQYQLKELGSQVFVYELKKDISNGEPGHYLCSNCFTVKKQKSILQLRAKNELGTWFRCNNCGHETVALSGYGYPEPECWIR